MKRNSLDDLLWLREMRTRKALERLTAKQSALRSAEDLLIRTSEAVEKQLEIARKREAAGLSFLMGRLLTKQEIDRFRDELGSLDHQVSGLKDLQTEAKKRRDDANIARQDAGTNYRKQHVREEKLRGIIELEERKLRLKRLTMIEVADEDAYARKHNGRDTTNG